MNTKHKKLKPPNAKERQAFETGESEVSKGTSTKDSHLDPQ